MASQHAIVAVIAGGRGDRIGGAKPSVVLAGRPLVCHPLAAAAAAGLEAIVVAKRSTPLPAVEALVVYEPELPRHPLLGVLTALNFAAGQPAVDAVLAIACDMPFVNGPLLAWLATFPGAAMAQLAGCAQPLLARYPLGASPLLEPALCEGRPLRTALEELAPAIVAEDELSRFGDPARLCFNVNDAADLLAAGRLIEAGAR
jgi:molybdenum cofactor guanylyltransferase